MSKRKTCLYCQSERIIPEVCMNDYGHMNVKNEMNIEVQADPKAILFKKNKREPIKASVCCDCGRIELYINNKEALWEVYQESLSL